MLTTFQELMRSSRRQVWTVLFPMSTPMGVNFEEYKLLGCFFNPKDAYFNKIAPIDSKYPTQVACNRDKVGLK